MKKALGILLIVALMLMLVGGAFIAGHLSSQMLLSRQAPPAAAPSENVPPEFQAHIPVFWEAWRIVKDNFYRQPIDEEKMVYGAIGGMVDSLGDPHTAFVDAKRAKMINERLEGSFEGIGATVDMRQGRLVIVAPIKGTPAEKAGLKPGDVILQVDDTPIENMDLQEAISLIRGKRGTQVRLKVQRGGEPPFELTITRARIEIPFVETKFLEEDNIAYIKLTEFSMTAPEELKRGLRELLAKDPKALIFDLRGNPGGTLSGAVEVASQFLKQGDIVLIEKFKGDRKTTYRAEAGGVATDIPMVLLIDKGSASASELVAAALKDHKRATVIGQPTFGKGSVQLPLTLSDGSQLRVTIATFYSPNDTKIHEVGVTPDIEAPSPTEFEAARGIDPQLEKAVEFIRGGGFQHSRSLDRQSASTIGIADEIGTFQSLLGRIYYNLQAVLAVV